MSSSAKMNALWLKKIELTMKEISIKSYVQYLALITTVDYDRFMEVNDINSISNYYTIFSTKHRRGEQFECAI